MNSLSLLFHRIKINLQL